MRDVEFFLASPLEKVFPNARPAPLKTEMYAWRGTRAAVQLVYYAPEGRDGSLVQTFALSVEGVPVPAELYAVELLPSDFPCWENAVTDANYLTHEPGLFPDLLRPLEDKRIRPVPRQYRSVWLSFDIPADAAPGVYEVTVTAVPDRELLMGSGAVWKDPEAGPQECRMAFRLHVGMAELAAQTLIHTEWFYADCLASYYHVPVFSEEHWHILDCFMEEAARRHGVNMLLTPVFTPPLDTAVGTRRPTVQLVGITVENGAYSFDFTTLRRWVGLCRKHGIAYLEMPHLFTQWGARATPNIVAEENGKRRHIFGWDVPADSPAYRAFLEALLPALRSELEAQGYGREHVYFHISDEPSEEHLESYLAAKHQVEDLLEGCPVVDALSSFEFYRRGLVAHPIPADDHIQPFIDAQVPDLWTYYCCAQGVDVPNRFYAMPSARNRILGVLLYLYDIRGFLHWGYNFYYRQYSRGLIDPYAVTHCDFGYPSGDPYLVYPGPDGRPLTSIRAEVQSDALTDLRALQTLERAAGREAVCGLIYRLAEMEKITFKQYPRDNSFLLALRKAVFEELEQAGRR